MTNKSIRNNRIIGIEKIQEFLLIVYIILSPVYKCLNNISLFGVNPMIIVICILLATYVININNILIDKQKNFFSFVILFVFCIELLFAKKPPTIGWVLAMLLYVFFLQTDVRINVNNIYTAFMVSAIIAGIFSVGLVISNGTIVRTAFLVDGSISPIAIVIALFCDSRSYPKLWELLKIVAVISSIIVLLLGMSRSRLLIVAICFAIYFIIRIYKIITNGGKVSLKNIFLFGFGAIACSFALISTEVQELVSPITDRLFNEGLGSMGRDVELEFGLEMFSEHYILGGGWGQHILQDLNGSFVAYNNHCAYVAILARGGLLLAVPVFMSYFLLLYKSIKVRRYSSVALMLMLIFLLLSYGNAGMFNYTVCSLIPIIVVTIKRGISNENQQSPLSVTR